MMKTSFASQTAAVCLFALASVAWAGPQREDLSPAVPLFEKALWAGAEGQATRRAELLREAVRLDPDFELARWHLGQVFFQGKWCSIESVGRLVSHDPRWQEYRDRVAASDDSPQAHAALARWCRDQRLESEAKWHWLQVLQADANHREALGSLGLKHFQGGLYTDEQITELQEHREQAKKDFNRYQKRLKRLVSAAKRGSEQQRSEALAEIAAIDDPAAIEALADLLVETSSREKPEGFALQVCQAVVAALSDMTEHEATLKLLEIAVLAPQAEVRHEAASALRYRELTSFVPLLMASLAAPLESTYSVNVLPSGHVTLVEDWYEEGPLAARSHVRSTSYASHKLVTTVGRRRLDPDSGKELPRTRTTRLFSNPRRDLGKAYARVTGTNQRLASENETRAKRNALIKEVLEIATDLPVSDDPIASWNSWKLYNELYTPEKLPVYETYGEDQYQRFTEEVYRPCSCFVAGTPVWTQSGPQPIEQIGVGEMVLSQNPITGQLDYRPVVGTTIRPPSPVVELSLEGETIVATRGHRFWVAGHGWRMAKFLSAGNTLFGGKGSVDLGSVAETEDQPAYNLVVGEFHTYFVGHSRLLVHDNNCPQPTTATVPGAESLGTR